MVAFTAKFLSSIKPPASGRVEHVDDALKGLVLRVTSAGAMSWNLRYTIKRSGKPQQRLTLGHFPQMTLAQARARGGEVLDAAQQGIDLIEQEAQEEAERVKKEKEKEANTVSAALELYVADTRSRNRAANTVKNCIKETNVIRAHLGNRPLAELKRKEVQDMCDALTKTAPAMSVNVWKRTNAFLNWCVSEEMLENNVCASTTQKALQARGILQKGEPRERVLDDAELKAVLITSEAIGLPGGWGTKLILLTGARREEVFGASWTEFDLDKGEWVIPKERYKTNRTHVVPLPTQAVAMLRMIQATSDSEWVFPGTIKTSIPYSSYPRLLERITRKSKVHEWTLHDLRRTVRTGLSRLGVLDEIAERVIGHVVGGTMGKTYNQHAFRDEKAKALQMWADHMDSLLASPKKD